VPQYLVIGTHAPEQCPGLNKRMSEIYRDLIAAAPAIGEKHGVKRIGPIQHMDPAHKIVVTLEGPNEDAVLDSLMENRLAQVQAVEIYRLTPLEDMFKRAGEAGHQPLL